MDFDFDSDIDNDEKSFRRRVGSPCPNCHYHIHKGDRVCCHCGHRLNPIEILNAKHYRQSQIKFGVKSALVVVPLSIAFFTLFFWLIS